MDAGDTQEMDAADAQEPDAVGGLKPRRPAARTNADAVLAALRRTK
jgi:hypothetical protein